MIPAGPLEPTRSDTDGDNIPDGVDLCPAAPETWNKYRDHDGCPDTTPEQMRHLLDSDADGVPDTADMCPAEAEDRDGVSDADGCPDP